MTVSIPPNPIRYTPDVEQPEADEAETTQGIMAQMRKIGETVFKDSGHAERGVHAKSHGLLRGELEVLPGLPPALAQGLFARPGTYSVILRLSTNPGDILDDSVSTPRGLGLKIGSVAGERLPDAAGDTQDFVMANGPAFAAANAKKFLSNLKLLAATTDTPQALKKALSAVLRGTEAVVETFGGKSTTLIGLGGHPETHILGETFYSQVPVRYGDYIAKVAVMPASAALKELTGASLNVNGKPNGLREAVTAFFADHDAVWDLCVQLNTGLDTMPIEDASVVWPEAESPYTPVARITVKRQEGWNTAKHDAIDDHMAFSPWHGLLAHQPLGSIMRVRKAAYEASRSFRATANQTRIVEPTDVGAAP